MSIIADGPEHPKGAASDNEGASLADVLVTLFSHKVLVLGLPAVVAMIAAVVALLIPDSYQSEVQLVPSRIATGPILMGLAKSDLVRLRVIERLELAEHYRTTPGRDTEVALESRITTRLAKDGGLVVTTLDGTREFAAKLADTVAEETIRAAHEQRLTAASLSLERLKARLAQVEQGQKVIKDRLDNLGVRDWQRVFPAEIRGLVVSLADIEAELSIDAPNSELIQGGIIALQDRLLMLERFVAGQSNVAKHKLIEPVVFDATKELYFYAALKKRLDRRVEMTDVDIRNEIKPVSSASVPLRRSSPKRTLIVLLSVIPAFIVASLIALVIENRTNAPVNSRRISAMRLKGAGRGARIE